MKKTATIIVTFNAVRNNWIYKCLDSLLNSTLETEIIVVDNDSKDETVAIIKEKYPSVKLIEAKENLGFGKANNRGIEEALKNGAEYFFLLNQDAWVEPDTIEKLYLQISNSPEFGILSPLHLTGDGEKLDWNFEMSSSYKFCPALCSDFILGKNTDKIYETLFVCAAAWLISKDCLRKVGGFNPTFYHYVEDDNYIHRAKFKGIKAGIYPEVKMYHDRENRPFEAQFWNEEYVSKNKYLMNILNPSNKLSVENVIKHLRISLLKMILKGNRKSAKQIKSELNYFNKERKSLEQNLKTSIENDFAFLKYREESPNN